MHIYFSSLFFDDNKCLCKMTGNVSKYYGIAKIVINDVKIRDINYSHFFSSQ